MKRNSIYCTKFKSLIYGAFAAHPMQENNTLLIKFKGSQLTFSVGFNVPTTPLHIHITYTNGVKFQRNVQELLSVVQSTDSDRLCSCKRFMGLHGVNSRNVKFLKKNLTQALKIEPLTRTPANIVKIQQ